jgi:hypothetical protein
MNTPKHLFASDTGELFDTRSPGWSHAAPLRAEFRKHFQAIESAAQFKATLRAGAYAWPGGYPLYLLCSDGAPLCFRCARTPHNAAEIIRAVRAKDSSGWRVVACDINHEDSDMLCANCGKAIESAYGDSTD